MPQSIAYNYSHITFSTKDRFPFIDEEIQNELFQYIGGICKNMDFKPVIVGGYKDHIHILCVLSRKVALMKLIEEAKAHSSKWMKTKGEKYKNFYWQRGYGSFSVNPAEIDVVIRYIENQSEHHKKKTFQEEYLAFLKKYKVEYDERYLWD
ncbi:IS200/IS605 family transposase [Gelidibacter sp.]|jgi:REP element-mobilizing transposase RayT|uniref:IS200/IS605 family transposase n=1 Tax=Gelidibacter sp. TaxID=2018083 RepID=UPI002BE24D86|nr:IS200/IS605 family transposase [Gelidibacter sp.]HUH26732.1 IS200/IS605 family transposase [Gelidibacter sp.]